MKKYKKFLFLFLILVIIISSFFIYDSLSNENEDDGKEKALSEIEHLENKLELLFNKLNNIENNNYSLSVKKIEESSSSQSGSENSNGNSEESGGSDGVESKNASSGEQSTDSSNSNIESKSNEGNNEEYNLEQSGILTNNNNDIDWKSIKLEVESLYSEVSTITLDLYSLGINREDVLGFNQELDNLTISVKEENKESTLSNLSKLYDYIPKYLNGLTDDEIYKAKIETKNNLFKAYSILDSKNWQEIGNNVTNTINSFSNNLLNKQNDKQYIINKIYIMLNELQSAVDKQDDSIFLIKYKNILEEISVL